MGRQGEVPTYWPEQLRIQLSTFRSHESLVSQIGETKTTVGVFEVLAKIDLPAGGEKFMELIPRIGDPSLEKYFDLGPRNTTKLQGHAVLAVHLGIGELEVGHKNTLTLRNLLDSCEKKVREDQHFYNDIRTAGRTLSRLKRGGASRNQNSHKGLLSPTRLEELRALEALNRSFGMVPWWWFE